MLRSINHFHGTTLGAVDGNIGHVKDIYVDDQSWAVRYLVLDTGSWLSGRQVLISPHAFKQLDVSGKRLAVKLTKKQIEDSPVIETHKPVSRQFEIDFYQYYGFAFYWQGSGLWGMGGFPMPASSPVLTPDDALMAPGPEPRDDDDPHLRSTNAITGYHIEAYDGAIGTVSDFIMDDMNWSIPELVIKTGGWFSGSHVTIPTTTVDHIRYESSSVYIHMTREAILRSRSDDMAGLTSVLGIGV